MSLSKWPFLVLFSIAVRKSAVASTIFYFTMYYLIGYRRLRGLRESKFPRVERPDKAGLLREEPFVGVCMGRWLKENSSPDKSQRCLPERRSVEKHSVEERKKSERGEEV